MRKEFRNFRNIVLSNIQSKNSSQSVGAMTITLSQSDQSFYRVYYCEHFDFTAFNLN